MKSKFFAFILSFVPGVGHLYLGQMNRGLQLLIMFFGSIFLIHITEFFALGILLPVICFFSLFDALQQHTLIQEGIAEDRSLFSWRLKVSHRWVAYVLIGTGVYVLFNNLFNISSLYWDILQRFNFPTIAVSLIFIMIGIQMLTKPKSEMKKEDALDETP